MSRTTDILLSTGVCDYERIEEFKAAMEKNGFVPEFDTPHLGDMKPWVEKEVPGRKVYTNGVWAVCWNYGQSEILFKTFREFDWEQPEDAVLLYADEQRGTEVIRPEGY